MQVDTWGDVHKDIVWWSISITLCKSDGSLNDNHGIKIAYVHERLFEMWVAEVHEWLLWFCLFQMQRCGLLSLMQ